MPRGIIHYYHHTLLQVRNKIVFNPLDKHNLVDTAWVTLAGKKFQRARPSCYYVGTPFAFAPTQAINTFTYCTIAMSTLEFVAHPTFVQIHSLFFSISGYLFLVGLALIWVALAVVRCLFFRVKRRRFIAHCIALLLTPNCSASSC